MSMYLDLETDRWSDDEECCEHVEWITIVGEHRHVHIRREQADRDGARRIDPEAGLYFHAKHLDAVIEALTRLRADLPAGRT